MEEIHIGYLKMTKTIEKSIETETYVVDQLPVVHIKNKEQAFNILKTHVGYCMIPLSIVVNPETFQPHITVLFKNPKPNNIMDSYQSYVIFPIELVSDKNEELPVLIEDHGWYSIICEKKS